MWFNFQLEDIKSRICLITRLSLHHYDTGWQMNYCRKAYQLLAMNISNVAYYYLPFGFI